jgi:hypothetical protein
MGITAPPTHTILTLHRLNDRTSVFSVDSAGHGFTVRERLSDITSFHGTDRQ